jgi:DNA transposition AAA+ family ATPase
VGPLFAEVAGRLIATNRPVFFVDEPDKLTVKHLEVLRDLTESTGAPFVLIGEEQLPDLMKKERRIWSRTFQQVEFKPFAVADIVQFCTTSASIRFTSQEAAEKIYKASDGDIRLVKIIFTNLVQVLNAKGTAEADELTVDAAIRQSFPK